MPDTESVDTTGSSGDQIDIRGPNEVSTPNVVEDTGSGVSNIDYEHGTLPPSEETERIAELEKSVSELKTNIENQYAIQREMLRVHSELGEIHESVENVNKTITFLIAQQGTLETETHSEMNSDSASMTEKALSADSGDAIYKSAMSTGAVVCALGVLVSLLTGSVLSAIVFALGSSFLIYASRMEL